MTDSAIDNSGFNVLSMKSTNDPVFAPAAGEQRKQPNDQAVGFNLCSGGRAEAKFRRRPCFACDLWSI
jgi:hypothetical protein